MGKAKLDVSSDGASIRIGPDWEANAEIQSLLDDSAGSGS